RVVVRPLRAQGRLQVGAGLQPVEQAQVRLQREVRDVVRGQLAVGRGLFGSVQHAVQVDLESGGERRSRARVVDLDLEGVLCAGGRGAQEDQDQAPHGSTVR